MAYTRIGTKVARGPSGSVIGADLGKWCIEGNRAHAFFASYHMLRRQYWFACVRATTHVTIVMLS